MTFDIQFISRTTGRRPIAGSESTGQITLGEFTECFVADITYWRPDQYQTQWRRAVERIIEKHDGAALLTSVGDPATAASLDWWPMYRVGSVVYVQNAILVLDRLPIPFDLDNPYEFVPERRYDGEVSEWQVSVGDLKLFLARG